MALAGIDWPLPGTWQWSTFTSSASPYASSRLRGKSPMLRDVRFCRNITNTPSQHSHVQVQERKGAGTGQQTRIPGARPNDMGGNCSSCLLRLL